MAQITPKDLAMVQNPDSWPKWPILAMKHDAGNEWTIGLMVAEGEPKVYLKNMWELTSGNLFQQLKDCEVQEFSSFEELLKVWLID
jgi:hypothetical protein